MVRRGRLEWKFKCSTVLTPSYGTHPPLPLSARPSGRLAYARDAIHLPIFFQGVSTPWCGMWRDSALKQLRERGSANVLGTVEGWQKLAHSQRKRCAKH